MSESVVVTYVDRCVHPSCGNSVARIPGALAVRRRCALHGDGFDIAVPFTVDPVFGIAMELWRIVARRPFWFRVRH